MPKAKSMRAPKAEVRSPKRGYEVYHTGDLSIGVLSAYATEITKEQYEELLTIPKEERPEHLAKLKKGEGND